MAVHVKFKREGDGDEVHFSKDAEWTLCGCAYEGRHHKNDFKVVKSKVDCSDCIGIIEYAKSVKRSEYI